MFLLMVSFIETVKKAYLDSHFTRKMPVTPDTILADDLFKVLFEKSPGSILVKSDTPNFTIAAVSDSCQGQRRTGECSLLLAVRQTADGGGLTHLVLRRRRHGLVPG